VTMKAHTYYIIFGRPPIGGSFPLPPSGGATDSAAFSLRPPAVACGCLRTVAVLLRHKSDLSAISCTRITYIPSVVQLSIRSADL